MDKGIWVTGSGTAKGARDECVVTVGSEVRRPSAAGALAASAESLRQMRAVLLGSGMPESALTTSAVSLTPVYDQYPTVAGFQAAVQLTATTRDVGAAGDLVTAVVEAGGDAARVHDISFHHSDASGLMVRAREAAWADALARASQLAALAGRELGDVLAIDETVGRPRPPGPLRMAAMAEADAAGTVWLDAGEGAVVVSLTVGWSLR
jgi:hypothetical protein